MRLGRVVAAVLTAAALLGATAGAAPAKQRDVFLVANAFDGTIDVFSQRTLRHLDRIDTAPDYRRCVAEAGAGAPCVVANQLAAEGTLLLNDDMRVSPDGRTMYVSRPSLGDVAAFDLRTEALEWRVPVTGLHPDHLALSPDGERMVVSAKSADLAEVIDARSASVVGRFPTGESPHGNEYSADGELIYNGSFGRGPADGPPCRCWITVVDAETLEVQRVHELDQGVRPFVVMPGGAKAYVQLTFLHGLVEYGLRQSRVLRTLALPFTEETAPLDPGADRRLSTSHGLALSPDRRKLCVALTVSDYVAIVRRRTLSLKGTAPVGAAPAWAASTDDGRYCLVPNRDSDDVSVISFRTAREVERLPAGDHPRRIHTATVRLRRPVSAGSRAASPGR